MDVKQIRKTNILKLYEQHGGPAGLARKVGTSESYLSQITSDKGTRNIGDQLARKIEKALALPRGWMDMLAFQASVVATQAPQTSSTKFKNLSVSDVFAKYNVDRDPNFFGVEVPAERSVDHLFTKVPKYDVELSAGHGSHVGEENGNGYLYFRKDWLEKKDLDEKKLCVVYVKGNSMEPTICDKEVILVDSSEYYTHRENIDDGFIYAINIDGEAMVKRLFRRPGGGIIARSDSPAPQYRDIILDGADIEYLRIIGRAIWHAGDL